ncbi:MAG: hypothetical protein IT178_01745 [Acidobacteria bacterium]|nr:hypothetical protein [Acidobacteriota bacterium]
MRRAIVVLIVSMSAAACAARGPSPQVTRAIADALVDVRAGCYRCLESAVGRYDALPPDAIAANVARQHVEALILLALRQGELGMPVANATLQRAQRLAAALSPSPASAIVTTMIDAASQLYGPDFAAPTDMRRVPYPEWRTRLENARDTLAAVTPPSLPAEYVRLSIVCATRTTFEPIESGGADEGAPLLQYRRRACGPMVEANVAELFTNDPRWFEASWQAGRRELTSSRDVRVAEAAFQTAANGLPEAPMILIALANAQQARRQLEPALANYDRTIALVPESRSALLGRMTTLSYLRRHEEAIATATRMIELGTYSIGDAYYWRAWNQYQRQQLTSADEDAAQARALMANTSVFLLSGVVRYDLKDLPDAQEHLERARELDNTNCQAVWYLGLVHVARPHWPSAAAAFVDGVACFRQAATDARRDLERAVADTADEAALAPRRAELEATIKEADLRSAQSAFNAAQCLVRSGESAQARNYLAIAAGHPEMKAQADALLEKLPPPE